MCDNVIDIEIRQVDNVYFPTHKIYVDNVEVAWGHSFEDLKPLYDELQADKIKAKLVKEVILDV